ncbi:hypothetical protein Tco_0581977 [Tanacetum coccineum]
MLMLIFLAVITGIPDFALPGSMVFDEVRGSGSSVVADDKHQVQVIISSSASLSALISLTSFCVVASEFVSELPSATGTVFSAIISVWWILETIVDEFIVWFGVNVSLNSGSSTKVITGALTLVDDLLLPLP